MASGGFAGSTFGDQIERVYRNVMSNQREFTANLSAQYYTGGTTLTMTGIQAQSIQVGSILAVDTEVFLVQAVSVTTATVPVYTVTVTYAYGAHTNATPHLSPRHVSTGAAEGAAGGRTEATGIRHRTVESGRLFADPQLRRVYTTPTAYTSALLSYPLSSVALYTYPPPSVFSFPLAP